MPVTDYKTESSFSFHFGKTKTKKKRQIDICENIFAKVLISDYLWEVRF